tara:strand:+ start:13136 stop:13273 length:138 start_codon:yes stop_codon:yes gene_type:complete
MPLSTATLLLAPDWRHRIREEINDDNLSFTLAGVDVDDSMASGQR